MKKQLKLEIGKAIKNKCFILSITFGFFCAALSAVYILRMYYSDIGILESIRLAEKGNCLEIIMEATTLYNSWMGAESMSIGSILFFRLLPLLAVLPCGYYYSKETNGDYLCFCSIQCSRTSYLLCKAVAAFLAGGIVIVVPLLFSFLLVSLFIPAISPNIIHNEYFSMRHGDLFSGIAYSSPLLFTFIYLLLDFVFAGFIGCLTLPTALIFKHRAAPIIVPVLFITASDFARMLLYYRSYAEISPLNLMRALQPSNIATTPVVVAWLIIFFAIIALTVMVGGKSTKYMIINRQE